MAKTQTELRDELAKEIQSYLKRIQDVLGWSQSAIARKIGATPSAVNKALKGRHILGYPKLMVLADESGHPIPASLTAAVKAAGASLTDPEPSQDARRAAEEFSRRPRDWQDEFLKALGRKG